MMSGVPHHCIIYVSFKDILVLFSLQRLNCILDHCTYVHGCVFKKVKLINHDCLPILMLYVMLACLMLFAALSNAVCLYNASFFFANAFCFMLCLGLLTHSLFISSMIFHHAQCFFVLPNSMFTPFFI